MSSNVFVFISSQCIYNTESAFIVSWIMCSAEEAADWLWSFQADEG